MKTAEKFHWENLTKVTQFELQGFSDFREFQSLFFAVILIIYIATILGNSLIFILIGACPTLHTPMYSFLRNLSFLEICYTSVTVPKMLTNLTLDIRIISYLGCLVQMSLFACLGTVESFLLTAMAYDRYVAICHPLHYFLIMNRDLCVGLVAGSWLCGATAAFILALFIDSLNFCQSNTINHLFCDIVPLIKLACGDTSGIQTELWVLSIIVIVIPFALILFSYIRIIFMILAIPSAKGRPKAFSTCSSHLMVVSLFYGTSTMVYLGNTSSSGTRSSNNKFLSLLYSVLTPVLNPVIYGLRNKEVKEAFKTLTCRLRHLLCNKNDY